MGMFSPHSPPPNLYYIRNIFKIEIKSGEIHLTTIELLE